MFFVVISSRFPYNIKRTFMDTGKYIVWNKPHAALFDCWQMKIDKEPLDD